MLGRGRRMTRRQYFQTSSVQSVTGETPHINYPPVPWFTFWLTLPWLTLTQQISVRPGNPGGYDNHWPRQGFHGRLGPQQRWPVCLYLAGWRNAGTILFKFHKPDTTPWSLFFPDGVSYCNVDAKREGRPSEKLKQKENAHWQRLCGDCLQRVRASLQYWHCQVSVHICGEQLWRYWWWMKHSLPGGVGRASRLWKQQDQRALQAGDGQHHRSSPSDIKVMGWIICWISAPNEKATNTGKRNGAGRGWCRTKMLHGSLARSFIVLCQMMIFYCICCISRLLFIAALLPS